MVSAVIIGILCVIIFFLTKILIERYLNYINDMQYILDAIDAFTNHCEAYKDELLCPDYFRCCLTYYNWFKEIKNNIQEGQKKNLKGNGIKEVFPMNKVLEACMATCAIGFTIFFSVSFIKMMMVIIGV